MDNSNMYLMVPEGEGFKTYRCNEFGKFSFLSRKCGVDYRSSEDAKKQFIQTVKQVARTGAKRESKTPNLYGEELDIWKGSFGLYEADPLPKNDPDSFSNAYSYRLSCLKTMAVKVSFTEAYSDKSKKKEQTRYRVCKTNIIYPITGLTSLENMIKVIHAEQYRLISSKETATNKNGILFINLIIVAERRDGVVYHKRITMSNFLKNNYITWDDTNKRYEVRRTQSKSTTNGR